MIKETVIDLETCAVCCLSCNFCPRGKVKRKTPVLQQASAENLASVINDRNVVWLSGLGEPLLCCPDKIVKTLKQTGAKVYSNTNAAFSNFITNLEACVKEGLSFLNISVYGWDEQSYKETTLYDRFNLVKENIKQATTILPIRLSFVKTQMTPEDIKTRLETVFNFSNIRFLKEHARGDGQTIAPLPQCALCNNYLFISSDGIAYPCINDAECSNPLGTDFNYVPELKKQYYPWNICHKCDCPARTTSFKEGYFEQVFKLDIPL